MKTRNFVAKHSPKFNTARVFDDRKARAKRGYEKHKKSHHCAGRNDRHS